MDAMPPASIAGEKPTPASVPYVPCLETLELATDASPDVETPLRPTASWPGGIRRIIVKATMRPASYFIREQLAHDSLAARQARDLSARLASRYMPEAPAITDPVQRWHELDAKTADEITTRLRPFLTKQELERIESVEFITAPADSFNAEISRTGDFVLLTIDFGFRLHLYSLLLLLYEGYGRRDRDDLPGLIPLMLESWAQAEEICLRGASELTPIVAQLPPVELSNVTAIQRAESLIIVFVVLHELGHLVSGHLEGSGASQPDPKRELLADSWAVEVALRGLMDPKEVSFAPPLFFAVATLIERTHAFLERIGSLKPRPVTHPPSHERVANVCAHVGGDTTWYDSSLQLYEWGVFAPQSQIVQQREASKETS